MFGTMKYSNQQQQPTAAAAAPAQSVQPNPAPVVQIVSQAAPVQTVISIRSSSRRLFNPRRCPPALPSLRCLQMRQPRTAAS